ncbi:MAG: glycosyltransferase family 2 protein [Acidobacteria bacterium]|nr:glycosyltransferase family 2 protein [Acidobacteriota bacterium]
MSVSAGVVSVIVVNWNRRELLRACLESLAAQTYAPLEVVLVDNGSTDGSAEMAEAEFGGRLALTVFRSPVNLGFCAGNNRGIERARGELIALLNNDAEAGPEWAAELAAVFEGRPEVGMAASKILVHEDPKRIDKVGHLIYLDGQNRGRGTGQIDRGQFDRAEEVLWPDGCAAMYRRAMLDEIGLFDEDFFAYADDAELGLRARIAGWRCMYVPGAVVRHHRGSSLGLLSSRRLQLIERNRILLAVKLFPLSLLWLNGVYWLARMGAGVWAGATGRGEAARFPGLGGKVKIAAALVRGNLSAMPLLPRMLSKRRQLRRFRKLTPSQVRRLLLQYRISLGELSKQAV